MAKSINNIITHGLSGKVGDLLVFSQRNGKTIVSMAPKRKAEDSEKQKAHKQRFQQAVIYAKSAIADPTLKEQYEKSADRSKGITSYNIALADLMNAPKIEEINLSEYTGKAGDKIKIKVLDDFKVKSVKVKIQNADGSLVEEGTAVEEGQYWIYTTTANNKDLSGDKITITATDTPDNVSHREEIL